MTHSNIPRPSLKAPNSTLNRPYQTLTDSSRPYQTLTDSNRPYQTLPDSTSPYSTLPALPAPREKPCPPFGEAVLHEKLCDCKPSLPTSFARTLAGANLSSTLEFFLTGLLEISTPDLVSCPAYNKNPRRFCRGICSSLLRI